MSVCTDNMGALSMNSKAKGCQKAGHCAASISGSTQLALRYLTSECEFLQQGPIVLFPDTVLPSLILYRHVHIDQAAERRRCPLDRTEATLQAQQSADNI